MTGHGANADDSDFDYDRSSIVKSLPGDLDPALAIKAAGRLLKVVQNQTVMDGLETMLRESYKFIRLTDDLHDIKFYLNDIRLCFVVLTISGYVGILLYFLVLCVKGQRRGGAASRRRSGDGRGLPLPDEEARYGWKGGDELIYNKGANKTTYDIQNNRYATRSLNRNIQPNFHNSKMDSIVDSPSKKRALLENQHSRPQHQFLAVAEPTLGTPTSTWENGDLGNLVTGTGRI